MRVLVVHRGRRDDYQVARTLVAAGHHVHLVTSGYGTNAIRMLSKCFGMRHLRKLADRRCASLKDEQVAASNLVEVLARCLGAVLGRSFESAIVNASIARRALRCANRESYDVIFCYSYSAFKIFVDPATAGIRKIIFQCHPHPLLVRQVFLDAMRDGIVPEALSEQEFSYSKSYQAMLIAETMLADQVVCASSFTRLSLRCAGIPDDRISVVPYGISSEFKADKEDNAGVLRVIFVGQFVHRKGIKIIQDILNRVPFDVEARFIGRGGRDLDPEVGIVNSRVSVQSFWDVDKEFLLKSYAWADAFLFPSLVEGFAQVILEAMKAGCVPIVSDATCGPDVIRNGVDGFVIPASLQCVGDYVNALGEVSNSEKRRNMQQRAVARASEFTWERFGTGINSALASASNIEGC